MSLGNLLKLKCCHNIDINCKIMNILFNCRKLEENGSILAPDQALQSDGDGAINDIGWGWWWWWEYGWVGGYSC